MKIDVIEQKLKIILEDYNYEIFSIRRKKEFGEHILEILIDADDLTTDVLEVIHQRLVDNLEDDDLDDNYYLELSSVGAERPIRSYEELKKYIGNYMFFNSNKYKGYATLESLEENNVCIFKINLKGRMAKIEIKYEELNGLRLAVKI